MPQRHNATVPQCHNPISPQCHHCATVLQCHCARVPPKKAFLLSTKKIKASSLFFFKKKKVFSYIQEEKGKLLLFKREWKKEGFFSRKIERESLSLRRARASKLKENQKAPSLLEGARKFVIFSERNSKPLHSVKEKSFLPLC